MVTGVTPTSSELGLKDRICKHTDGQCALDALKTCLETQPIPSMGLVHLPT